MRQYTFSIGFHFSFLATGLSFRRLAFSFKMGVTTVSKIVREITKIVWDTFHEDFLPVPTMDDWIKIAEDFYRIWNFPHCLGSGDGKHIRIKNPPHEGTMFHDYKHLFSIVLQGLVDANYKFICVDVGSYGKQSDGGIFRESALGKALASGRMEIPNAKYVPEGDIKLPYVIIGDEAYPLLVDLLKPYSRNSLTPVEYNFNKRLSWARRTVEHAFGIIVAKWRILNKSIETNVDVVVDIVKSICVLHNIIISMEGMEHNLTTMDQKSGRKRARCCGRPSDASKRVRYDFAEYFARHPITQNADADVSSNDESSSHCDTPDSI